jgi:hypothetical protein
MEAALKNVERPTQQMQKENIVFQKKVPYTQNIINVSTDLVDIPEREAGALECPAPQRGGGGGGRSLQVLLQQLAQLRQLLALRLLLLLQTARVRRLQVTLGEIPATNPPISNRKNVQFIFLVQL